MQFIQQQTQGAYVIRRYGADFIVVGDREIRSSCLVALDQLIEAWPPCQVDQLTEEHLAPIFACQPQVVVLATGPRQQFPSARIRGYFGAQRIGLEVMEIGAACRTYNVLISEGRVAVAAILLPAANP
jgi:uncharacterized protein